MIKILTQFGLMILFIKINVQHTIKSKIKSKKCLKISLIHIISWKYNLWILHITYCHAVPLTIILCVVLTWIKNSIRPSWYVFYNSIASFCAYLVPDFSDICLQCLVVKGSLVWCFFKFKIKFLQLDSSLITMILI